MNNVALDVSCGSCWVSATSEENNVVLRASNFHVGQVSWISLNQHDIFKKLVSFIWLKLHPSKPFAQTRSNLYMVNTSRRGASSQKASLVVKNHIQDSVGMWIEASGFVACSSPLPIKMIAGAYPIWHASVDQTNSKVDLWPDQSYKWSPDPLSHLLWHPTLAVRKTCQQKTCQRLRGNVWLWG